MRLKTISVLLAIVFILSLPAAAFASDTDEAVQTEPTADTQFETQTDEPAQPDAEEPEQEQSEPTPAPEPEDPEAAEPNPEEEQPADVEPEMEIVDDSAPVIETQGRADDADLDSLDGLKATRASHTSIRLSWSLLTGAEQYNIYRSESKTGEYQLIKTQSSVSAYTDTELKTCKTYYYKVEPVNSVKTGTAVGPVWAKTTLDPVADFTLDTVTCTSVRLKWSGVEGANKYVVYRSTDKDDGYKAVKSTGATARAYTDTTVEAGVTYYYKMIPYCDSAKGEFTEPLSVKATFAAFQSLVAESVNFETIKISWSALDGATKYLVYRSDAENGTFANLGSVKGTEFTDNAGLIRGNTYYYKVVPYSGTYRGAASDVVSAVADNPDNIQAFIDAAYAQVGKTYVLGGKGPTVFDCSGLIYYALKISGNNIPYMTSTMWRSANFTTIYDFDAIQPGDVLCFSGHVALYVGNNTIVDASSSNGRVVERSSLGWRGSFICAKRPLG